MLVLVAMVVVCQQPDNKYYSLQILHDKKKCSDWTRVTTLQSVLGSLPCKKRSRLLVGCLLKTSNLHRVTTQSHHTSSSNVCSTLGTYGYYSVGPVDNCITDLTAKQFALLYKTDA